MEWVKALAAIEAIGAKSIYAYTRQAQAIGKRANDGLIRSRARLFCRTNGKLEQRDENVELPREFWWPEGHEALEQNWQAGDFSSWPHWLRGSEWRAFGVEFCKEDIEAMGGDFADKPVRANEDAAVPHEKNKGGAPRSAKWNDFMAELCLYLNDSGYPPGVNTQGADALIGAIQTRLQERGLDSPERSTVQPVVNAVLRLFREQPRT